MVRRFLQLLTVSWLGAAGVAPGNGVLHEGFGARDAGAAGVFAGTDGDALSAMQTNPAALAMLGGDQGTISLRGGWANGRFTKGGRRYQMEVPGGFPEAGLAWRPAGGAVTLGASVAPLAAAKGEWVFPDAAGGIGGISYGAAHPHDSGFLAARANVGLGWRLGDGWAVGASIGAVYGRVDFDAPFIFQTHPALAGAKVDLDLATDGWEAMYEFGAVWEPRDDVRVEFHCRPQVTLDLDGRAGADFSAQLPPLGLGGTPALANYRAHTRNALPTVAGAGLAWQMLPRFKAGLRLDWIGWGNAFDVLDVSLTGGTNAAINGAIGAHVADRVPVRWKNTWVIGLGGEYEIDDQWSLRGGWRWGESPVPSAFATPLNASLLEHTLAVGLGWRQDSWRLDLSYEYQFGGAAKVMASGYRAGEYANSKLDFDAHVVGLGLTVNY
ncbi:hypothetical protein Hsar01_02623 [Haloferula sargassicola]|uniref:Long-chain fatty acid transporter n=1 Tax=Haloferula sargassicola TaxID=490096 RepID=A0ABP9URQ0_9BACT